MIDDNQAAKPLPVLIPGGVFFERLVREGVEPSARAMGMETDRVVVGRLGDSAGALRDKLQGCRLALVEIGGLSPALFHAAGLAEGLGARVLYMGPSEAGFPFPERLGDLLVHGGSVECLRAELPAFLQAALDPANPPPVAQSAPVTDRFTSIFGEILRKHGHIHRGAVEEEDAATFILHDQTMDLALVQDLARKARALGLRLKLM